MRKISSLVGGILMQGEAYRKLTVFEETNRCLLCLDAPCTAACPSGLEPDRVIRSIRFENLMGARNRLPERLPCATCESLDCVKACLKGKMNEAVDIPLILQEARTFPEQRADGTSCSLRFCGIACENPFFLSSSVVGSNYEMIAKAFEMGWAGVVYKSISAFVPKDASPRFGALRADNGEIIGLKNIEQTSDRTLAENLAILQRLKQDFPKKVVIASIMGRNEEEWTELAESVTATGIDMIECNFSCPHMAADGVGSDVGQNRDLVKDYIRATRKGTPLPILAKMTSNTGNMVIPAIAAVQAGATGIAAINTIKSMVNIHPITFGSDPDVNGKTSVGGYSGKAVKPIALHFIQSMKANEQLKNIPVSGMGGITTWRDALEYLAVGCENVQVTTAVMLYGYRIIEDLVEGLRCFLASGGYASFSEVIGKALPHVVSGEELDRDSLQFPRFDKERCVGCGRCIISCYDGGHQALCQDPLTRKPVFDPNRCVGCHLCIAVCPVQAITPSKRILIDNLR